jgi:hypothetical protein
MKSRKFQEILYAVLDRRLYGPSFFLFSGPPLGLGFVMEVSIYRVLNQQWLAVYVPLFVMMVLISGLGSKNLSRRQEVSNMGYFRGFLFLIASVLAAAFPFLIRFQSDLNGLFQFVLTFALSTVALTMAIVEVTIFGQRISLRNNIGLNIELFKKQKKVWENNLEGFPHSEKIISNLEDGRFVPEFFDRGSFSLAVLWSCNVMEEIIDAAANGIIEKDPTKKLLFKNEKGGPLRYPLQLKNLNYVHRQKTARINEQMDVNDLWDDVRNRIAHHKYKPTFDETYGALIIFVSFMEQFPKTLCNGHFSLPEQG